MAHWWTSQLNGVEMGVKLNFFIRQYFKKCPNNDFSKKEAVFHETENMNLTDPMLKVSQWLIQTANSHMVWPEILLFSFF